MNLVESVGRSVTMLMLCGLDDGKKEALAFEAAIDSGDDVPVVRQLVRTAVVFSVESTCQNTLGGPRVEPTCIAPPATLPAAAVSRAADEVAMRLSTMRMYSPAAVRRQCTTPRLAIGTFVALSKAASVDCVIVILGAVARMDVRMPAESARWHSHLLADVARYLARAAAPVPASPSFRHLVVASDTDGVMSAETLAFAQRDGLRYAIAPAVEAPKVEKHVSPGGAAGGSISVAVDEDDASLLIDTPDYLRDAEFVAFLADMRFLPSAKPL
jgi:hypothetical protein